VLAPQPFYQDRGTPIALLHVLRAMSRLRVQVDVVTFPVGADVTLPGVRILRGGPAFGIRNVPIGLSLRKLLFDVGLTLRAWHQLRSEPYTAVYASEEAIVPAILLGRSRGLPVIYDMQSSLPEQLAASRLFGNRAAQHLIRRWERWCVRSVTAIACSAGLEPIVGAIAGHAPVDPWRYPGPAPGHSADELTRLRCDFGIDDGVPIVFYGGSYGHYQGIEDLLQAMPAVLAQVPEAIFVLAGKLPEEPLAVAAASIPDRSLRLAGALPRDRALACLALADVVVSTRRSGRNLPLKIIDYLAAGKAIVATDHPAHRAALDESRALLVAPEPQAIADGIVLLLRDRGKASKLAAAARQHAAANFGAPEFEDQVLSLLRRASGRELPDPRVSGAPSHG
jgi:glycosyltransferase involved in cell wall biosynthesis